MGSTISSPSAPDDPDAPDLDAMMRDRFPPGAPHPRDYRDTDGRPDHLAWRAAIQEFMREWRARAD